MKQEATYGKARKVCRLEDEEVLLAQALNISPGWMVHNNPSSKELKEWKDPVPLWLYRKFRERAGKKNRLKLTQQQLQMTVPPAREERDKLYAVLRHQMFGDIKSETYHSEKTSGIGTFKKSEFLRILAGLNETSRSLEEILAFLSSKKEVPAAPESAE